MNRKQIVLEVKDASFSYSEDNYIFSDVSFNLKNGEVFIILGPNGTGKSTLLNCLANLISLKKGQILLEGKDLRDLQPREIAKKIGYLPQMHIPTYSYRVRDYIVMGRAPHIGLLQTPGKNEYEMVYKVLDMMKISHLADKPYNQLSGGELQQVQIARVLVQNPDIIMMDEPTNHLDYGNQHKTLEMIVKLSSKGYSIILTTHMPDHAILLGGTVGILDKSGHMVTGPALEIINKETLVRLYNTNVHLVYIEPLERVACVAGTI